MEKEVKGTFVYEQDSKRYHRFQIETEEGICGVVYIQKIHSHCLSGLSWRGFKGSSKLVAAK